MHVAYAVLVQLVEARGQGSRLQAWSVCMCGQQAARCPMPPTPQELRAERARLVETLETLAAQVRQ